MSASRTPGLLFSLALRPMFLLVVLHALVVMTAWSLWFSTLWPFEVQGSPVYWHGHEMLNGFAGAAIGGFLLTAVATWTKRPHVSGLPLMLLCLVWLGGRLSVNSALAQLLFDAAYWLGLAALMANEVLRAGNRRNYKILTMLGLLFLSDLAYHLALRYNPALQRQAVWGQLWLVLLMINLVGGRVIPAFTRNWLARRNKAGSAAQQPLPAEFGALDVVASLALVVFAVSSLLVVPPWWIVPLGTATALLQGWRLVRWQGHRTLSDPLVWMLHLAYAWIPMGIALLTLGFAGLIPVSAGIHALGTGAVAGMIISVSSRAALGHTGRALQSHPLLTLSIVLLTLATCLRIGAAISASTPPLHAAAGLWIAAFLCYAIVYVPVLLMPARTQSS